MKSFKEELKPRKDMWIKRYNEKRKSPDAPFLSFSCDFGLKVHRLNDTDNPMMDNHFKLNKTSINLIDFVSSIAFISAIALVAAFIYKLYQTIRYRKRF